MSKNKGRHVAPELAQADLDAMLLALAAQLRTNREEVTTRDDFAYETGVSRSAILSAESGKDFRMTTFLRILHGLNMTPLEFFKELEKGK